MTIIPSDKTWLSSEEILQRLDYFNKSNDWSVFYDVPEFQQVSVMYPNYPVGYRTKEVECATDPRLK